MERDCCYQKLLFDAVFSLVFIIVTHKIAGIQFHCEQMSNMRHLNRFKHMLWKIKRRRKKQQTTLLHYEIHFGHFEVRPNCKKPGFIFEAALFEEKCLRRPFVTGNSNSYENSVVDKQLTHACGRWIHKAQQIRVCMDK